MKICKNKSKIRRSFIGIGFASFILVIVNIAIAKGIPDYLKYFTGGEYPQQNLLKSEKDWTYIPTHMESDIDEKPVAVGLTVSKIDNSALLIFYRNPSYCSFEVRISSDDNAKVFLVSKFKVDGESFEVGKAMKLISVLRQGRNIVIEEVREGDYKEKQIEPRLYSLSGTEVLLREIASQSATNPTVICNTNK